MTDIKHIIARNITDLRVSQKMTQLELAEQLNYSDKSVSKWERGDSMPDVSVLVELAEIFGVTLDYLVHEDHPKPKAKPDELPMDPAQRRRRHVGITAMSVVLVWFIALLVFVMITMISGRYGGQWIAFVYAVPVSAIVWLVLNSVWFNPRLNYVIVSILVWSCLMSFHLTLLLAHINVWMLYLLGIPGELIIVLWAIVRKKPLPQDQDGKTE